MNENNRFKDRLKMLRNEKEMSGSELGAIFGVTKVGIHGWESGKRNPSLDMLMNIADYFEVSLDYLMGKTNIRNAKVFTDVVDGKDIKIEADMYAYPDKMSHEEVLRILKSVKKLKKVGIDIEKLK